MNCNDYLPLICGYLDGENTESENKTLQTHLESCASCREILAQMQENDRLLADAPEAPADLSWRIMQQVRKEPKKRSQWKHWSAVLSAAAVLAVVLLSGVFSPAMEKRTEAAPDEVVNMESGFLYRAATEAPMEVAMEATLAGTVDMEFGSTAPESMATFAAFLITEPVSVTEDFAWVALEDAKAFLTEEALALLDGMALEELQAYFVPLHVIDELKASGSVECLSENAEAENYIIFLSNANTP